MGILCITGSGAVTVGNFACCNAYFKVLNKKKCMT